MNHLYVGEETGDLKIDLNQVLLSPFDPKQDLKLIYSEEKQIVNFGLIVLQMVTNDIIVDSNINEKML